MLKTDKALYLVRTKEDYDNLMIELEKMGVVWPDGRRPTTAHYWEKWREKTIVRVYDNTIVYGDMNFYLKPCYRKYHFEVYRSDKVKLKSSEKFVADWYEENKDDFENNLYEFIVNGCYVNGLIEDFSDWFYDGNNSIQILVNMHQFGYELEQEPNSEAELKKLPCF